MSNPRFKRKKEHLILALQGSRCSFANSFSEIILLHNCLTEVNPKEVDLAVDLCGYRVASPVFINAITGGALVSEHINRNLAVLAAKYKLPMAVGSQMAALKARGLRFTYKIVRKTNPGGIVIANLSASATPQQALEAIDMIQAQILQLHINPAQEFIMPEGDKVHPRLVDNIAEICAVSPVPVVVKEVGFGIGKDQAQALVQAGVRAVDVSGTGGTNFARIEGLRNSSCWWKPFSSWGLPTPLCVADVRGNVEVAILASGGVDDGLKALKCLALGADAVGVAGSLLKCLYQGGLKQAEEYIHSYLKQIRVGAALMGVRDMDEARRAPVLITGKLKDLFAAKGIDPLQYRNRG